MLSSDNPRHEDPEQIINEVIPGIEQSGNRNFHVFPDRADAVRKVGGYDEEFTVAQDLDLWLKLGEVGKLACVPQVLLRYRQHADSVGKLASEPTMVVCSFFFPFAGSTVL